MSTQRSFLDSCSSRTSRKKYSEAAASLHEILSLVAKVESIDYGVVHDRDVHFFTDWVVQIVILQTSSIPERHTAENMNFVSKNII